jgi:hypothetical protein
LHKTSIPYDLQNLIVDYVIDHDGCVERFMEEIWKAKLLPKFKQALLDAQRIVQDLMEASSLGPEMKRTMNVNCSDEKRFAGVSMANSCT